MMTCHVQIYPSRTGISIGSQAYNTPAIPIDTEGIVYIPDSIQTPDGRTLPVLFISRGAFQGCVNLEGIRLPHELCYISDLSFHNCKSLRELTLPAAILYIYPKAFEGCVGLRRITMLSDTPPQTYTSAHLM